MEKKTTRGRRKAAPAATQTATQAETITAQTETTVKEEVKREEPKKDKWVVKDRTYFLLRGMAPLSYRIPSRHTARYPLLWFDEESQSQRELRYATNQNSPFVDEQKGEATLSHIIFQNGTLSVNKENIALQKLLSVYHPLKGVLYEEFDPEVDASENIDMFEAEYEAMTMAKEMDVDQAEAILRAEIGSKVSTMSSAELKRDLFLMARNNPMLFLDLANDDSIHLRNIAVKSVEQNIINLSADNRTFTWGSNGRKLITVPFEEHPYSALAAFFKTDEGMEVLGSVEKKLI